MNACLMATGGRRVLVCCHGPALKYFDAILITHLFLNRQENEAEQNK